MGSALQPLRLPRQQISHQLQNFFAAAGAQDTILVVSGDAVYLPNTNKNPYPYRFDLFEGTLSTGWNSYSYDWTCPNGVYFASIQVYNWNGSTALLAVRRIECIPYAASAQWGSDITSQNTSNNTSNVGSTPASTVAGVIPDGKTLFLNAGSRAYSFRGPHNAPDYAR